jgi:hypothetical protein
MGIKLKYLNSILASQLLEEDEHNAVLRAVIGPVTSSGYSRTILPLVKAIAL